MSTAHDVLIPEPSKDPEPTARDWLDYDARADRKRMIEQQVLRVLRSNGPEAAANILRRWWPTYDQINRMPKPGTPEWIGARRG